MGQVTVGSAKVISKVDEVRLIGQVKKAIMDAGKIDARVVMSEICPSKGIDVILSDFGNIKPAVAKEIMEYVGLAIAWVLIIPNGEIRLTMHATLTYVM